MDSFNSQDSWGLPNQRVIDYHHQSTHAAFSKYSSPFSSPASQSPSTPLFKPHPVPPAKVPPPQASASVRQQKAQLLDISRPTTQSQLGKSTSTQVSNATSFHKYDPFVEDNIDDMDISDDENSFKNILGKNEKEALTLLKTTILGENPPTQDNMEVKSGAAFYKGLILYIPPFQQISNTYRGSPAMKMLYASFEFSFKMPIGIETNQKENMVDATVFFRDHIIATGSGWGGHVEASVRALELLSETCYTIQAKEDYFLKCKLVDIETMRTLNLKKWEVVCQKYPKLQEEAKEHIQKTFALFLEGHTGSGVYEDIVCCNLTRAEVNNIKRIVEFFHLTMLPCSVSTNLSKKHTPCVVSIHKYTSAQKLLDILVECGGENDKFKLYPPDTFKDFYKLHHHYWDPNQKDKRKADFTTTLEDEELQAQILKPYKNTISELFEKHKTLPKVKRLGEEPSRRKADDFMKENLQIDIANSKNVAPVERMQLLLKYMEQLQEYGSRVLTSGRQEMIKIYHNAIDNVRKDLETCRKDIEKEQKNNSSTAPKSKSKEKGYNRSSRSPLRRRISPRRRSKSPMKRSRPRNKSRSPRRHDRPHRSASPRRRPRSQSPQRRALRIPFRTESSLLPRKEQSPPPMRSFSPKPSRAPYSGSDPALHSIFKDQLRRYIENIRRFRIEIEDTPIEERSRLKENLLKFKEQLHKLRKEATEHPRELENFIDEIELCRDELLEQTELVAGKPCPSDFPRSITPPPWMNVNYFDSQRPISYPLPDPRPMFGARIPPPMDLNRPARPLNYRFPF